jgi:molybdate transport system substrate-binding protein
MTDEDPADASLLLFSGLALRDALTQEILPLFLTEAAIAVNCRFEPTSVLVDLIRAGSTPDVLLGVTSSVNTLTSGGLFAATSTREIVSSGIGIAISPGRAAPSFDTTEAFVEYLLAANSVAYSRSGASGIYFSSLLDRLGIAEPINAGATIFEKGFTAQAIVDGRADVAVQQLSELAAVPGVQVLDAFPSDLKHFTHFSAAIASDSQNLETATSLIDFLTSKPSITAFERTGLTVNAPA